MTEDPYLPQSKETRHAPQAHQGLEIGKLQLLFIKSPIHSPFLNHQDFNTGLLATAA
jgi:hypothetical protein